MQRIFTDVPNQGITRIGVMPAWTVLTIQVTGAASLRIAETEEALNKDGLGGIPQGLTITAAMGIQLIWWAGPLFAVGSAPGTVVELLTHHRE